MTVKYQFARKSKCTAKFSFSIAIDDFPTYEIELKLSVTEIIKYTVIYYSVRNFRQIRNRMSLI